MSEPSIYELRRRKVSALLARGLITEAEHAAKFKEINDAEQEEIRTLQRAIHKTRLNR